MTSGDPGHPFLGFVNSVTDDGKRRTQNAFSGPEEFLALLSATGLAPRGTPVPGGSQMAAIIDLRETAYALLSAMAAGRSPGREEALSLEATMKSVLQDAVFGFRAGGLRLAPGPLGGLHDRLVLSFLDLLQRPDLGRLCECGRCSHLFLDHGRGPGRRWCAMARCGNRAKAESFRNRRRATGA